MGNGPIPMGDRKTLTDRPRQTASTTGLHVSKFRPLLWMRPRSRRVAAKPFETQVGSQNTRICRNDLLDTLDTSYTVTPHSIL